MSGRVFTRITSLVAVLSLVLALPAFAQTSPTTSAYGGKQGEVLGNFNSGGQDDVIPRPNEPTGPAGDEVPTPTDRVPTERGVDAPTPAVATGELPFTGIEAGLVGLFGLALLGSGIVMRRASRNAS